MKILDELALYDRTREELRKRLSNQFPSNFDLERTITAYAYWVCTEMQKNGQDWESTLQEYVDYALRDAIKESKAEKIEFILLQEELRRCRSPLLDVGAGWGRLSFIYASFGLRAIFVEPTSLGCRLLRRNALLQSVRCVGQLLSFPDRIFQSVVIGWVLHHDSPQVPSTAILQEVARVTAIGGRLISIEPLWAEFNTTKWKNLIESSGFEIRDLKIFFDTVNSKNQSEQYAFLTAIRHS
jgi:SAM-dependent methyltransferase